MRGNQRGRCAPEELEGSANVVKATLAAAVGADPRALHRLMRALTSLGVFTQRSDERF